MKPHNLKITKEYSCLLPAFLFLAVIALFPIYKTGNNFNNALLAPLSLFSSAENTSLPYQDLSHLTLFNTVNTLTETAHYLDTAQAEGAFLFLDFDDTIATKKPMEKFRRELPPFIMEAYAHSKEKANWEKNQTLTNAILRRWHDMLEFLFINFHPVAFQKMNGADVLLEVAHKRKMKIILITNRPEDKKRQLITMLTLIGINIEIENIICCGQGPGQKAHRLKEAVKEHPSSAPIFFVDNDFANVTTAIDLLKDNPRFFAFHFKRSLKREHRLNVLKTITVYHRQAA